MVFNSFEFLLFFIVVFLIYWLLLKGKTAVQNIFLLLASYFFYAYADWKMLPLLFASTAVFYYLGIKISIAKSERVSSAITTIGVLLGVGVLLYFKYLNFFIESFASLFESIGLHTNWHSFNILMPLGISFFTFKLISYVVEVHRGKIEPTRDFIAFATYISFFPCILSGPIDRPTFINQLKAQRVFDYNQAVDGMRQILWGLFKKVVVADNCATYVNEVWNSYQTQNGSTLLIAAILYSFQMYADFSGYSDMAIGVGKLLGLKITPNFKTPFFALNVADFWRRWHMSLTTWLTDYVFMPLNIKFRDLGKIGLIFAIIINMVVVGLWHGANWTFAVFGLYHGLLFVPLILSGAFYKKSKVQINKFGLPSIQDFGKMLLTFLLVTIGLIIFRAENIEQAFEYIGGICDLSLFSVPLIVTGVKKTLLAIAILFVFDWLMRMKQHSLQITIKYRSVRWLVYYAIIFVVLEFGANSQSFIYFNF